MERYSSWTITLLFLIGSVTVGHGSRVFQEPLRSTLRDYIVEPYSCFLDNVPSTTEDQIYINTGDRRRLVFGVRVTKNNQIICEQNLTQISRLKSDNPSILFSDSSYDVEEGSVTSNRYPLQNPFAFVSWYGGSTGIHMTGMACLDYTNNLPTTVTANLVIRDSSVDFQTGSCPISPRINGTSLELTSNKSPHECSVSFKVTNGLDRNSNYAIVQTKSIDRISLVASSRTPVTYEIPITVRDSSVVLDANFQPDNLYGYRLSGRTNTLRSKTWKIFQTTYAPKIEMGNGCYTKPINRSDIFYFSGIKFHFEHEVFILQDFDKLEDSRTAQTPIGGASSVVQWSVKTQADRNEENGEWIIDPRKQSVKQPMVIKRPKDFKPEWWNYAQNPARYMASFNEDTKCWDLNFDIH